MAISNTKVMKHSEAHKLILTTLKHNFSGARRNDEEDGFNKLEEALESLVTADNENKKLVLDQLFREFLTKELISSDSEASIDQCQMFVVNYAIPAARAGLCSPGTAIQVLSDMFDLLTLSRCEELFSTVEQEVATWREPLFFASGKNNLLRICNDLLRRLSRTQNTVFCGRILLFLAKFFPFSERSGLNVISEFNLDNVTNFNIEDQEVKNVKDVKEDAKPEPMDEDEVIEIKDDKDTKDKEKDSKDAKESKEKSTKPDDQSLSVDHGLYKKFWQIQDFFRNPVQCYQREPWRTFSKHSSDVLAIFQSFKLDSTSGKSSSSSSSKDEQYFAKYLTNQNLLQLQLSDSNFRRYVLLQFLILFHYLKSEVKFKTDSQKLSSDQEKWTDETSKKIYKLLEETPPDGKEFAKSVKHILKREEHWNKWKNEGCQSLAKKVETNEADRKPIGEGGSYRRKKRKLGDVVRTLTFSH